METRVTTVSKLNSIDIQCVERDNEMYVPIRPICDILGIDLASQRKRIKRDEILGSVAVVIKATSKDDKKHKMFCLPIKYIFGWLLSIDTSRVKDEAKEAVIAYKKECYNIFYDYLFGQYRDIYRQIKEEAMLNARIEALKDDLRTNPPQDDLRIKELLELEALQFEE